MNGHNFLDTNVLVYALDAAARRKYEIAQPLLVRAIAGEFVISSQVLGEFASTLLDKYRSKLTVQNILTILDSLVPIPLIQPDARMVRRAVEAHAKYGIHFYDGMIVAAAERAGAEKIFSEDLNAGQKYFGVTVINPFL